VSARDSFIYLGRDTAAETVQALFGVDAVPLDTKLRFVPRESELSARLAAVIDAIGQKRQLHPLVQVVTPRSGLEALFLTRLVEDRVLNNMSYVYVRRARRAAATSLASIRARDARARSPLAAARSPARGRLRARSEFLCTIHKRIQEKIRNSS